MPLRRHRRPSSSPLSARDAVQAVKESAGANRRWHLPFWCRGLLHRPGSACRTPYSRRGATLNTGTKTTSPVDYETAKDIYDKLVREKTGKGYTPGENGTPYQSTGQEDRATGILPQLLNPIDEEQVERLLKDDAWVMREKHDGRRTLIHKQGPTIRGINRKELVVGLPSPLVHQARQIAADFILDGECISQRQRKGPASTPMKCGTTRFHRMGCR